MLNNWINVIKYFFESNSIEWVTLNYSWVITNLTFHKHFDLVKIVLVQSIKTFYSNLYNGMELYYLNPYGYDIYDEAIQDNQYNHIDTKTD